jgi:ketosteroid isomerase-like protein
MPASLELVKIALQAYASGDCEIALALAAPQVRWDERASRTDGDLVWGHDNVQRAMRRYLDGWEDYRFELEDLAEVGPGTVVGICRERGKPEDATPVDRRFGGLWVVEGGKITSWATYLTPREAVRAAKELLGGRVDAARTRRTTGPVATKAAQPAPVESEPERESAQEDPEPIEPTAARQTENQAPERPRKRALTKSEEQKRAARARARLRKLASRESA